MPSENKFKTISCLCFPFDIFGSAGCGDGAKILIDIIREIIDDTKEETRPTRTNAIADRIEIEEFHFDTMHTIDVWRATGFDQIRDYLEKPDNFTLWLGGNHLSVLPVYEALQEDDLIIQFDAHLDLYHLHDTQSELSHGNFIREVRIKPSLINIGHRDLFLVDDDIDEFFDLAIPEHYDLTQFKKLNKYISKAKRIWIDIDIDVMDPEFCPGAIFHLPFGMQPPTLLQWLDKIWETDKVVGMSFSEYCPARDQRNRTMEFLGWLIEWSLLKVK